MKSPNPQPTRRAYRLRRRKDEAHMIRSARADDTEAIAAIAIAAEMFAAEDAGFLRTMMSTYYADGVDAGHVCVVDEHDGVAVGVAYYQPKTAADRVWDLTMIGVRPEHQGSGHGSAMLRHLEDDIRARGGRLLLIDTSGTTQYDRTRAFYAAQGYDEEARIRDYWAVGDDLVVFRKELGGSRAS